MQIIQSFFLNFRIGRVTIRAKKNRVVGHPVQQNVIYIKMFGIICSI